MLVLALAACWAGSAMAQGALEPGGLTFRDFAVADHGASFSRNDSIAANSPISGTRSARLIGADNASGKARNRLRLDQGRGFGATGLAGWRRF